MKNKDKNQEEPYKAFRGVFPFPKVLASVETLTLTFSVKSDLMINFAGKSILNNDHEFRITDSHLSDRWPLQR